MIVYYPTLVLCCLAAADAVARVVPEPTRLAAAAAPRAGAPLSLQERTLLDFNRQGDMLTVSSRAACSDSISSVPPAPRTDYGITPSLQELPHRGRRAGLASVCHSHIHHYNDAELQRDGVSCRVAGPVGARRPRGGSTRAAAVAAGLHPRTCASPSVNSTTNGGVTFEMLSISTTNGGVTFEMLSISTTNGGVTFEMLSNSTTNGGVTFEMLSISTTNGGVTFEMLSISTTNGGVTFEMLSISTTNGGVTFEMLSIRANFTNEEAVLHPLLSEHSTPPEHLEHVTEPDGHVQPVKVTVTEADSLLAFGLFGRVFGRDHHNFSESEDTVDLELYDYIFNDDVHDFFDYLWIRVRILMIIVSIYVLEMM